MNKHDFYKELYFNEINRKEKLDDSSPTLITFFSAFIGALYFLCSTFDYTVLKEQTIAFLVLAFITFVLLIIAIVHFLIIYNNLDTGHRYSYFPFAKDIDDYDKELIEYYKDEEDSNNEFNTYIRENMIKHIDYNTVVNDNRSLTLYRTKKFILYTICALFLTIVAFGINFVEKGDKIQKIEITNNHK